MTIIRTSLLVACALLAGVSAGAQDIEPRAYTNIPVGMNFLVAGGVYTKGGLAFDPSSPLQNPDLNMPSAVVAYARGIGLWGKSGKIDIVVPYTWLSGSADYRGQRVEREVDGLGNASFRLSVNLYGAPALRLKEFAGYRPNLIAGATFQVITPWGQYDPNRLVNISTNRWAFRIETGISKVVRRWTLELGAAAIHYTDNHHYYGGITRSQDPLFMLGGHVIYSFRSSVWASFDASYFSGGRTTVGGVEGDNLQQNWRTGGTLSFPVNSRHSLKLFVSSGVSARTGNNYDLFGAIWQYRWGGGL